MIGVALLGVCAVASTLWRAGLLHADEQRASLRLPSMSLSGPGSEKSRAAIQRRMSRLQKAARRNGIIMPETGEVFARTRQEAERKIILELVKQSGEIIPVPEPSVASLGLCEQAIKREEMPQVRAALQQHGEITPTLRIEWDDSLDEKAGHAALQKALGRSRYIEVARQCDGMRQQEIKQETEAALNILSAHLGISAEMTDKVRLLAEKRNQERDPLDPDRAPLLKEIGKLMGQPELSREQEAAFARRYSATEERYARQFKDLLGPQLWKRYEADILGASGTSVDDLDWIQWVLFRAPADQAQTATEVAASQRVHLIPNKVER
jgi:hypothetical protein